MSISSNTVRWFLQSLHNLLLHSLHHYETQTGWNDDGDGDNAPCSPPLLTCCMVLLQASAWRELEGPKLAPWTSPPDSARKTQRLKEMDAARTRCRSATSPKIREQVNAIETGAESINSVVFHSFHLLLISADNRGFIHVNNGADGSLLNSFHVTNGE